MIIPIKTGSILRSNDPRYSGEKVRVIAIVEPCDPSYGNGQKPRYAVYQAGRRKAKINIKNIKQPNEPHYNRGWTVVG